MIPRLSEWYRLATIEGQTEEILNKRVETIKGIVSAKKLDWLFNCVRLYLNKPLASDEFISEFIKAITESDQLFKQTDNQLELRVLAGAIIHEYITTKKGKERVSLALGVLTSQFGAKSEMLINTDIIQNVKLFLEEESLRIREFEEQKPLAISPIKVTTQDFNAMIAGFEATNTVVKNLLQYVEKNNTTLQKKIHVLEEESNIHWWIFRGFSNGLNMAIKELDINYAGIVIGKELSNLITVIPGPLNAVQFVRKTISDSIDNPKDVSLKDSVNKLPQEYKEDFIKANQASLGNITPLILAFSKSIESDDEKSWIAPFEKLTEIKASSSYSMIELAYQSYLENLLTKSLK